MKNTKSSAMRASVVMLGLSLFSSACSYDTATLQGAQPQDSTPVLSFLSKAPVIKAETLLASKIFDLNATSSTSPLKRHMSARHKVHHSQTKGHLPYTDYLQPNRILASANFRVLKLEPLKASTSASFALAQADLFQGAGAIPSPSRKPSSLMARASEFQIASANTAPIEPAVIMREAKKSELLDLAALRDTLQQGLGLDAPAGPSVLDMRMGDYEDKTRLVLDLNAATRFDYDLNNVQSVLTVHLDDAEWQLKDHENFKDHPLFEGYTVEHTAKNETTLQINLKRPSKMLMSGSVRPDNDHGHRIFFDVAKL